MFGYIEIHDYDDKVWDKIYNLGLIWKSPDSTICVKVTKSREGKLNMLKNYLRNRGLYFEEWSDWSFTLLTDAGVAAWTTDESMFINPSVIS
jgi:uncharacterized protein (DUF608 family)